MKHPAFLLILQFQNYGGAQAPPAGWLAVSWELSSLGFIDSARLMMIYYANMTVRLQVNGGIKALHLAGRLATLLIKLTIKL
ncbi:hypothetical protein [Rouxiella sp. WC2420]|uniref:Secreted protein n=1 Tax=Rouxiella sp. WC2420 TaxID=3234145 RepID=A0AB39VXL9_9GAMM